MVATFEALLDSSILIDLLRDFPSAQNWAAQGHFAAISRITWFELIQGAEGRKSQKSALQMMQRFSLIEIEHQDIVLATELLLEWRPRLHIDTFDCILCASAKRLDIPFYTRNLKHFSPILGNLAQSPY